MGTKLLMSTAFHPQTDGTMEWENHSIRQVLRMIIQDDQKDWVLGDDLLSTPKASQSFSNSDLRHPQHSSDSDCLPVPETLQSFSYSKPLPAIPSTTTCSFHSSTSPDTSSKGCYKTSASFKGNAETSSNSTPSNLNFALLFSGYSLGCSGDEAAPAASDIKGHVIRVIHDIKGQGWCKVFTLLLNFSQFTSRTFVSNQIY